MAPISFFDRVHRDLAQIGDLLKARGQQQADFHVLTKNERRPVWHFPTCTYCAPKQLYFFALPPLS